MVDVKEQVLSAKCKIFMNCTKNVMAVKTNKATNEECLRNCRCKGTKMTDKCKIFLAVTEHFVGISNLYKCGCQKYSTYTYYC